MAGTWSAGADMATARANLAGGGSSANAICMGGFIGDISAVTEEYNGTAWGAGGNLATARQYLAGGGSSTDAICMGGYVSAVSAVTEEYLAATKIPIFMNQYRQRWA